MWRHAEIGSMGEIPAVYARETPDAIALIDAAGKRTFAQLEERTADIASLFDRLGIAPGAHIGFLGKNSALYFEVLFGAMRAACAILPLNWRLAVPEIAAVMKDAQVACVIVDREFVDLARAAIEHAGLDALLIAADATRSGDSDFDARLTQNRGHVAAPRAADPAQTALLIYTSGTTGVPKGVCISHRALDFMRLCEHLEPSLQWQAGDVMLMVMPNFHLVGTGLSLQSLYNGSPLSILPVLDPVNLITLIERDRPTICALVPTAIQMVLDHPAAANADLSSLRLVMYAGSPIQAALLKRAMQRLNCQFMQFYGATETSGAITLLRPEQHCLDNEQRLKSCGTPLPLIDVSIVDADGQPVADGEPGEIWVRTPTIFSRYWNQPAATEAAFGNHWYRTGDAGIRDAEGLIYIIDRVKDMIVTGGENVYSTEVEQVIATHPAVATTAVIGVPDDKWGERVTAVVVLKPGAEVTDKALIEHCRVHIAGYKLPKSVHFVDALPLTPTGKIAKRVIRDQLSATQVA